MKRAFAAIFVLVAACTSFEPAPAAPLDGEDAGGTTTRPEDAGSDGSDASVAEQQEKCAVIVEEPFDDRQLGAIWKTITPPGTTNSVIAAKLDTVEGGPMPVIALGTETLAQPNAVETLNAYVQRKDLLANVTSVKVEYDLAYAAPPQPHARVGCTAGLRSGDVLEARVFVESMGAGLLATGTLETMADDVPGSRATLPASTPPNTRWAHVVAEVSLTTSGEIARSLTVDGNRYGLPSFRPSARPAFDSVHVLCGIESAFAETASAAHTAVFMKSLHVTACTR